MSIPTTGEDIYQTRLSTASIDGTLDTMLTMAQEQAGEAPSWLDRCAWMAMQGYFTTGLGLSGEQIAKAAYLVAECMLTEKRRREGGAV